jgi:hypothetical protein
MIDDLTFLFEIASVASVLAAAFAVVSLVAATICIFLLRTQSVSIKLLGSLMVLALAFAAHHVSVYLLSIFIIATLVTDLDFLEKIAALFWNRDKYWEYKMGQASPLEVKARVLSEAQQEVVAEPAFEAATKPDKAPVAPDLPAIQSFVAGALSFERDIFESLVARSGPFPAAKISIHRQIFSASGSTVEIDAIVETTTTDYVIEVKFSRRPQVLDDAHRALVRGVRGYRAYLRERGITKEVIPVAIISEGISVPSLLHPNVPFLQYSTTKKIFVNQEDFLKTVRVLEGPNP